MTNIPTTTFKMLRIAGWRQFDAIDIELHERLTVITGANGAGKTSLLRVFSKHFGYERPYLATPTIQTTGALKYANGWFASLRSFINLEKNPNQQNVGLLTYRNSAQARLVIPTQNSPQYSIDIQNQQTVSGIHFDSHQPVSIYQTVGQIPTNGITTEQAFNAYDVEVRNRYVGSNGGLSPVFRMKEAIIAMAMFGEGNKYVRGNKDILDAYVGFNHVLTKVLPASLGFQEISIRTPEVVLVTRSGDFLLDASSGGIWTLVDIAWRLYMFSLSHSGFVVTMDEPENHLHPSMQRTLLPRLLDAFPMAQFIIATHSPFMVSAVRDSAVYVLRYGTIEEPMPADTVDRRVFSQRLDNVNKAGTASEILREVLGVPATIPDWVESDLQSIVEKYAPKGIASDVLNDLRSEMKARGYSELYSQVLSEIVDHQK